MREPLVSIVIPTITGREESFGRAVFSVMKQTYQNIEIIPIKDIRNACKARNMGIFQCRGDFIAFLDDDDEWMPDKIERQLKAFDDETNLVICLIQDRRFGEGYIVVYPEIIELKEVLKRFNLSSTSSYMFRASYLKKNMFNESLHSAQEYELAIRTAIISPIKCVKNVLVIQHRSEKQITRDWKKKKQGLKQLLKIYKTLYISNSIRFFRLKFFGLQCLYTMAYLVGDRIYKIIIPLKRGLL